MADLGDHRRRIERRPDRSNPAQRQQIMKTLGLTGGIGSGKSAAARIFADLGATVVSADEEARRLMDEDPELRRELVTAFGPAAYGEDGSLDRAYLAGRVFGNRAAIERLNAIVHPRVKAAFPEVRERAQRSGARLLVYEAALIVEAGLDDRFDAIAVVDAPSEQRIRRVMERDGVPRESVEARMQHQLAPNVLKQHADFVIDNGADLSHLRAQVEHVYHALTLKTNGG
jgi:dephospho-CoA kinase